MSFLLHSTIITTCLAATVAVGLASASIYAGDDTQISAGKSDRLPVVANAADKYLIIHTSEDGISVLTRMPIAD